MCPGAFSLYHERWIDPSRRIVEVLKNFISRKNREKKKERGKDYSTKSKKKKLLMLHVHIIILLVGATGLDIAQTLTFDLDNVFSNNTPSARVVVQPVPPSTSHA